MIYSTTLEEPTNLMWRQLIFTLGGVVGLFTLAFFDYRKLKKISGILYLLIVLALIGVWFFGPTIRGSTRWFDLGFFRIQPAEFAKLIMVIIMAKFLDQTGERLKNWRYILLSALYVGIPVGLILIEPDLGSASVVFFIWLMMLMFSKIQKKHFAYLLLVLGILSIFVWAFVLGDYQKERIYTFLDPNKDPQGSGYNQIQSKISVGSGNITGRGLGRGSQSQGQFLPERQTDFIFAATAEELGFLGSMFVLTMYGVIFIRLIKAIKLARDNFGMYLILGIFWMFLIQAVINIGMNIDLAPVTGIPLPLISYGGSSLLATFLALGLVQSVVARQKAVRF
jgi:rod shape determining protein RodA